MPRVNLITERRKRERRDEGIARVMVYACASAAAAFLLVFVLMTTRKYRLGSQIDSMGQQLSSLQPKIAEVQNLQQLETTLTPRLDLLQNAKDSTTHWYLIYQQTGQGLPATSWLNTIAVNTVPGDKDKAPKLTLILGGQSLTQDTVAETITQLQRQPMFQQVDLHFVKNDTPLANGGVVNPNAPPHTTHFEVAVQLKALRPETSAERAEETASLSQSANTNNSTSANPITSAIKSAGAIKNAGVSKVNNAIKNNGIGKSLSAMNNVNTSKSSIINQGTNNGQPTSQNHA